MQITTPVDRRDADVLFELLRKVIGGSNPSASANYLTIIEVFASSSRALRSRSSSFTEYYTMDYHDDVVLMGHDGPGHIAIVEEETKVRPLEVYHGKVGRGLSVEMSVRRGR